MAGSTYGNIFKISTWGESHGRALGVVVDGCPSNVPLSEEDIQVFLNRRKPGQSDFSTKRNESDTVQILSGVFDGKTTGTPISLIIYNEDQKSKDYGNIAYCYRPGHADFGFDEKFGFRDYRGGGRSSGRETVGRVAAGAIATKILNTLGVHLLSYTRSIGDIIIDYSKFQKEEIFNNPHYMPDPAAAEAATLLLKEVMADKDSIGSSVECIISGVPAGIGEPVFDKLDASLGKAVMSIGAVKAVEIGDGILVQRAKGSENNDAFRIKNGKPIKTTNHSGGTLGGISDGGDILVRASFKPTPSIYKKQQTITSSHEETEIEIKGRHDPIIGPRAVVVVEAMCAITLLDLMMMNATSKLENLIKIYN
ncbi:MAG: chorismate synthase [Clostridium sp.]|nr:chorismate synthase [Clostridium sp.]MCM1171408.1 chorismate synthase [Clostridium sp.]MCM1208162.1 chorismate synthase [Ruminococcus sp.]